jgi:acyl transferase domain-containing protein/surfactin synthase thioesterase subunit
MVSKSSKSLSPIKLAFAQIAKLESENRHLKERANEPIAIVGMASRFPGAPDTESFWRMLDTGTDAIAEVPAARWNIDAYYDPDPEKPGKMYTRSAGFLDQVDQFDASFFQMSPREAMRLDPQHRLLLEVSWEALEDAAISADRLKGSRTGVYMGLIVSDYMDLLLSAGAESIDPYLITGNLNSIAVGRISYLFGLQGPNLAIDTACSSSLVALHQACQDLRLGECDLALAGGVNVMIRPETTIALCQPRVLSKDGRCKTFDAAADGYGRAEGCGVVALKRLSDTQQSGDRVLAIIRGSAVNQDGASAGLTAPSRFAQEQVIRDAVRNAQIEPHQVNYLEAHGTGTTLGDPIEVLAAATVLGENRHKAQPLLIGSVKTNIGHLEAAAGIAGVIKVVLSMQHGQIPKHLHLKTPNPHIPWTELPIKVTTEPVPWPAGRKIAGVTAFGFSGANAHVVVEEAPVIHHAEEKEESRDREHHVLVLSARSDLALNELVRKYVDWLMAHPEAKIADVAFTAAIGRSHMDERAALVVGSTEEAIELFSKLQQGENSASVRRNRVKQKPKVAWLFTGQGSQYLGMGKELYETQPVVRDVMNRCAELISTEREVGLLEVLFEREELLNHTSYAQPALFALELAIAELLQSWGHEPDVVLGHSVGQYAAATVAGVMTLEQGLQLIAKRGELMGRLPPGGAMAAVFGDPKSILDLIAKEPELSLAADNGAHVVLSGPEARLEKILSVLVEQGIRVHRLNTSHAFHSGLMDPVLEQFESYARNFKFQAAQRSLICNLTGRVLEPGKELEASYWRRHLREPVRFAQSINTVAELGAGVLVEIGPQPVLVTMAERCWPGASGAPTKIVTLRQGRSDERQMAEAVAEFYVQGLTPDFSAWDRPWPRQKLALPTYPFQRRRYYTDLKSVQKLPESRRLRDGNKGLADQIASLKGVRLDVPGNAGIWEFRLSCETFPEVRDNQRLLHVGHYKTMVADVISSNRKDSDSICFEDAEFLVPIFIPETIEKVIYLVLEDSDRERYRFQIYTKSESGVDWVLHVRGKVWLSEINPPGSGLFEVVRERLTQKEDGEAFYAGTATRGLIFGPTVSYIDEINFNENEAFAALKLGVQNPDHAQSPLGMLAGVFDCCTQLILITGSRFLGNEFLAPAVGWDRLTVYPGLIERPLWCHFVLPQQEPCQGLIHANYTLYDTAGRVRAVAERVRFRLLPRIVFEHLKSAPSESDAVIQGRGADPLFEFRGLPDEKQKEFLCRYLTQLVAESLKMPAGDLDIRESLRMVGIDSLVGVEIKSCIDRDFSIAIPMDLFVMGLSIDRLSDELLRLLQPGERLISSSNDISEPNSPLDSDQWLVRQHGKSVVRFRLFCLPPGGLGASLFRGWQDLLPDGIEVCALQLPGREERFKERPLENLAELLDVLESVVSPELNVPFAFYGHSMGGLVAYRLAYRLWRNRATKPSRLFVGGYTAPVIYPNPFLEKMRSKLKEEGYLSIPSSEDIGAQKAIRKVFHYLFETYQSRSISKDLSQQIDTNSWDASIEPGIVERARLDSDKIPDSLLTTLIADLRIIESYKPSSENSFDVPITAFHGIHDDRVTWDEMQAWRTLTTAEFQCHVLAGDHFFLEKDQDRGALLKLMTAALASEIEWDRQV